MEVGQRGRIRGKSHGCSQQKWEIMVDSQKCNLRVKRLFRGEFRNPIAHATLAMAVQRPVHDHGVENQVAGSSIGVLSMGERRWVSTHPNGEKDTSKQASLILSVQFLRRL